MGALPFLSFDRTGSNTFNSSTLCNLSTVLERLPFPEVKHIVCVGDGCDGKDPSRIGIMLGGQSPRESKYHIKR